MIKKDKTIITNSYHSVKPLSPAKRIDDPDAPL